MFNGVINDSLESFFRTHVCGSLMTTHKDNFIQHNSPGVVQHQNIGNDENQNNLWTQSCPSVRYPYNIGRCQNVFSFR